MRSRQRPVTQRPQRRRNWASPRLSTSRRKGWRKACVARYAARGITGDSAPSEADLRLTRRVAECARMLQMQFLDHIIVGSPSDGRPGYFSFKEAGILA